MPQKDTTDPWSFDFSTPFFYDEDDDDDEFEGLGNNGDGGGGGGDGSEDANEALVPGMESKDGKIDYGVGDHVNKEEEENVDESMVQFKETPWTISKRVSSMKKQKWGNNMGQLEDDPEEENQEQEKKCGKDRIRKKKKDSNHSNKSSFGFAPPPPPPSSPPPARSSNSSSSQIDLNLFQPSLSFNSTKTKNKNKNKNNPEKKNKKKRKNRKESEERNFKKHDDSNVNIIKKVNQKTSGNHLKNVNALPNINPNKFKSKVDFSHASPSSSSFASSSTLPDPPFSPHRAIAKHHDYRSPPLVTVPPDINSNSSNFNSEKPREKRKRKRIETPEKNEQIVVIDDNDDDDEVERFKMDGREGKKENLKEVGMKGKGKWNGQPSIQMAKTETEDGESSLDSENDSIFTYPNTIQTSNTSFDLSPSPSRSPDPDSNPNLNSRSNPKTARKNLGSKSSDLHDESIEIIQDHPSPSGRIIDNDTDCVRNEEVMIRNPERNYRDSTRSLRSKFGEDELRQDNDDDEVEVEVVQARVQDEGNDGDCNSSKSDNDEEKHNRGNKMTKRLKVDVDFGNTIDLDYDDDEDEQEEELEGDRTSTSTFDSYSYPYNSPTAPNPNSKSGSTKPAFRPAKSAGAIRSQVPESDRKKIRNLMKLDRGEFRKNKSSQASSWKSLSSKSKLKSNEWNSNSAKGSLGIAAMPKPNPKSNPTPKPSAIKYYPPQKQSVPGVPLPQSLSNSNTNTRHRHNQSSSASTTAPSAIVFESQSPNSNDTSVQSLESHRNSNNNNTAFSSSSSSSSNGLKLTLFSPPQSLGDFKKTREVEKEKKRKRGARGEGSDVSDDAVFSSPLAIRTATELRSVKPKKSFGSGGIKRKNGKQLVEGLGSTYGTGRSRLFGRNTSTKSLNLEGLNDSGMNGDERVRDLFARGERKQTSDSKRAAAIGPYTFDFNRAGQFGGLDDVMREEQRVIDTQRQQQLQQQKLEESYRDDDDGGELRARPPHQPKSPPPHLTEADKDLQSSTSAFRFDWSAPGANPSSQVVQNFQDPSNTLSNSSRTYVFDDHQHHGLEQNVHYHPNDTDFHQGGKFDRNFFQDVNQPDHSNHVLPTPLFQRFSTFQPLPTTDTTSNDHPSRFVSVRQPVVGEQHDGRYPKMFPYYSDSQISPDHRQGSPTSSSARRSLNGLLSQPLAIATRS